MMNVFMNIVNAIVNTLGEGMTVVLLFLMAYLFMVSVL